jgi:hypothetical protein
MMIDGRAEPYKSFLGFKTTFSLITKSFLFSSKKDILLFKTSIFEFKISNLASFDEKLKILFFLTIT